MDWYGLELPALCVGSALVELDAVHVGQWMISRPLVFGPLLGWACGAPGMGASMGALMELITLDDLPVGGAMSLNAPFAAASAILLSAGPESVPAAAAFPAGLVFGGLFARIEARVRTLRAELTRRAESALDAGRPVPFRRLLLWGLGVQALASAALLYAAVSVSGAALAWGWSAAPDWTRQGFGLAFYSARCLGWATLIFALRPRR